MFSDKRKPGRDGGAGRFSRRPAQLHLGLQRVVGVRVLLTDEGPVSEMIGVLRRRPVVQPISLSTAAALVAGGTTFAVRRATSTERSFTSGAGADTSPAGR